MTSVLRREDCVLRRRQHLQHCSHEDHPGFLLLRNQSVCGCASASVPIRVTLMQGLYLQHIKEAPRAAYEAIAAQSYYSCRSLWVCSFCGFIRHLFMWETGFCFLCIKRTTRLTCNLKAFILCCFAHIKLLIRS